MLTLPFILALIAAGSETYPNGKIFCSPWIQEEGALEPTMVNEEKIIQIDLKNFDPKTSIQYFADLSKADFKGSSFDGVVGAELKILSLKGQDSLPFGVPNIFIFIDLFHYRDEKNPELLARASHLSSALMPSALRLQSDRDGIAEVGITCLFQSSEKSKVTFKEFLKSATDNP